MEKIKKHKPVCRAVPVYLFDLQGKFIRRFLSIGEAAAYTGCSLSLISRCCACNRVKTAKKQIFTYNSKLSKEELLSRTTRKRNCTAKAIYQYTLQGGFIKEWDNINLAAKTLNINAANIVRCLKGRAGSCAGFFWTYTDW